MLWRVGRSKGLKKRGECSGQKALHLRGGQTY